MSFGGVLKVPQPVVDQASGAPWFGSRYATAAINGRADDQMLHAQTSTAYCDAGGCESQSQVPLRG